MRKIALSAFAAFVLLVSAGSEAQAQKIGVIDSRTVLEAYPEYVTAVGRIQGLQKMWEDSLQMMSTQFKTKLETYQSVLDQLSPEKKKSAEAELGAMQEAATKFQQAKFGQQGELAQQQSAIAGPLFEKVRNLVSQYAKRDKYTMVLDKSAAIYIDNSMDITDKVVAYVKNGGK